MGAKLHINFLICNRYFKPAESGVPNDPKVLKVLKIPKDPKILKVLKVLKKPNDLKGPKSPY